MKRITLTVSVLALLLSACLPSVRLPQGQLVWLNFGGADDVRVYDSEGISFGPFDAALIGPEFAGETDAIKRMIVEAMRADYAGFDVNMVSSDESPEPSQEHSVVHFGGWDVDGKLGRADSVDRYNSDPNQAAIVYVENFARFSGLGMYVEEMAMLLSNVASHELGHLLGLQHVSDPGDLMNATTAVWDLAGDLSFLDSSLLAETVGVEGGRK